MINVLPHIFFTGAGMMTAWIIYNESVRHRAEVKAALTGARSCFFCGSYVDCGCAEALERANAGFTGVDQ